MIVSPSTLIATLRTIASIWRQEHQNSNALEIARQSGDLYDKFVGFVEDMDQMGNRIEGVQKSYDSAMKKLSEGRGNLVRSAQSLVDLGARNAKELPEHHKAPADNSEDPERP